MQNAAAAWAAARRWAPASAMTWGGVGNSPNSGGQAKRPASLPPCWLGAASAFVIARRGLPLFNADSVAVAQLSPQTYFQSARQGGGGRERSTQETLARLASAAPAVGRELRNCSKLACVGDVLAFSSCGPEGFCQFWPVRVSIGPTPANTGQMLPNPGEQWPRLVGVWPMLIQIRRNTGRNVDKFVTQSHFFTHIGQTLPNFGQSSSGRHVEH